MFENIEAVDSNFCIGPQTGTYCTVNYSADPVVMQVKNNVGTLIRNYSFNPSDTLQSEPYNYSSTVNEFQKIKYVGPYNQSSYYEGAIFYTLERIGVGYRTYYTYERDPEPNGPFKTSGGELITDSEVEYDGNIIRRWELDAVNFRLDLKESFFIDSDSSDWFDGKAFDVQTLKTELSWHVPIGTGVIDVTTTSGISKYDRILIGPSNDTSNVGAVDYAYVHSVSGTQLNLRTYGGVIPTEYEYVLGDPVTIYKDILLLSNPKPLINVSNIRYDYERDQGSLFLLDHSDYGNVKEVDYHGMYNDVIAAGWNNLFETFSFVHGQNLLHLNLLDYSVSKSQVLTLMEPNKYDYIPIYDLCIDSTDVYRLQMELFQRDDSGNTTLYEWSSYNYTVDALTPYTQSVTVRPLNSVLGYQGISFIYATVRDQFGVGLLGKNIEFSSSNDPGSSFIPLDGQVITDSDGYCIVRYTAGSSYKGDAEIKVSSDGGNTTNGSVYVVGFSSIPTLPNYIHDFELMNVEEEMLTELSIMSTKDEYSIDTKIQCFVRRSSPGGEWIWNGNTDPIDDPSIDDRNTEQNSVEKAFLYQVYLPFFHQVETDGLPHVSLSQYDLKPDRTAKIMSVSESTDERNISQNYLSRHLLTGHIVNSTINQYVFIQEARPVFWSVKNPTEIDYWIRLRPFSASLDPSTLKIYVRESSYDGINDLGDIAPNGTITTFDAGGGLNGVEFQYNFPDKFHHNAIVYIDLIIEDQALIPNILNVSYWFTIIADYRAPYVENRSPGIEEIDVSINTDITFDVLDEGEGVDITTLEVFVNNQSISFNYVEFLPGQYHIECLLSNDFHFGEEVYVDIIVSDLSENKNTTRIGWGFYCTGSDGPWFNEEDVLPGKCLLGMERDTNNIELQVYGINDTGIEYDSLKVEVGGKYRNILITPIIYRLK